VVGGFPDLLQGWLRVHAEVVAGLLRSGLGPAPLDPSTQVLRDDFRSVLDGHLDQVDRVGLAAADDRPAFRCPDVANPLGLAGQ
jgi:hypothetical protein